MSTIRKWLVVAVILVVLAVLAIAAASMWLNSYIHSDAFRADVEARASQSLGGPVQIEKIDFDIFHGVKLQGLVTQVVVNHDDPKQVQAKIAQVNCSYAFTELFSGKLKLTGVTLDQPEIVLSSAPRGPKPETLTPGTTSSSSSGEATQPSSRAPTGSTSSGAASTVAPAAPEKAMPFQFVLDRGSIKNGSVTLLNDAGAPQVKLAGVNVDANTAGYYSDGKLTGKVKIADIELPASKLVVTNFVTPVTYTNGALSATPYSATCFGGNLAGGYESQPTTPSSLDLNAKGVQMEQVSAAMLSQGSARVTGDLALQSKWRGVETGDVRGEGDVQLTAGKLEGVRLLRDIGELLKIKELDQPEITSAKAHFTVENRVVRIIGLQLESPVFRVTGDGTVAFDGALNADMVLILTSGTMSKLPGALASSFVKQADGSGSIAFKVTGTTSHPNTDLPAKLLMQNQKVKDVINKTLNKLFH